MDFIAFSHGRAFSTERPHPAPSEYVTSRSSTTRVPLVQALCSRFHHYERHVKKNLHALVCVSEKSPTPYCVFIILTLDCLCVSCHSPELDLNVFVHKAASSSCW